MNRLLALNLGDVDMGTGKTLSQTFPSAASLLNLLLKNSLTIIGIILLVLLIFGGFQYIMSAGSDDPKKAAQAKTIITDALVGFLVVFAAYFIIQIIQTITGVHILDSTL